MKRLTYRKNGRWMIATRKGAKPVKANPLYLFYRACDRMIVGPDDGKNHHVPV